MKWGNLKQYSKFSVSDSSSDGVGGLKALATGFLLLISMVSLVAAADTAPPTSSDNWTATGFVSESSVLVELTASDTDSSVANVSYRVNGGGWGTVSGSSTVVTIDSQGNNTLEYNATDTEGNVESTNTEYVALDSVGPVVDYQALINGSDEDSMDINYANPVIEMPDVSDEYNSVNSSTLNVSLVSRPSTLVASIEDDSSEGLRYESGNFLKSLIYNMSISNDSLSDGVYDIILRGEDSLGNFERINLTEQYSGNSFTVDTESPGWKSLKSNITTPALTYTSGDSINISIGARDNFTGLYKLELYANDTGSFRYVDGTSYGDSPPNGGGGTGGS